MAPRYHTGEAPLWFHENMNTISNGNWYQGNGFYAELRDQGKQKFASLADVASHYGGDLVTRGGEATIETYRDWTPAELAKPDQLRRKASHLSDQLPVITTGDRVKHAAGAVLAFAGGMLVLPIAYVTMAATAFLGVPSIVAAPLVLVSGLALAATGVALALPHLKKSATIAMHDWESPYLKADADRLSEEMQAGPHLEEMGRLRPKVDSIEGHLENYLLYSDDRFGSQKLSLPAEVTIERR